MSAEYVPAPETTSGGDTGTASTAGATESLDPPATSSPEKSDGSTTTSTDESGDPSTTSDSQASVSTLRFSVRTSSLGGTYQPRNVGAIWIETPEGEFVRTLKKWGTIRSRWLSRWNETSDGNVIDAVTAATRPDHETHQVDWDLTAPMGAEVERGPYVIVTEITDRSGPGDTLELTFDTRDKPTALSPPDTDHFHDIELTMQ